MWPTRRKLPASRAARSGRQVRQRDCRRRKQVRVIASARRRARVFLPPARTDETARLRARAGAVAAVNLQKPPPDGPPPENARRSLIPAKAPPSQPPPGRRLSPWVHGGAVWRGGRGGADGICAAGGAIKRAQGGQQAAGDAHAGREPTIRSQRQRVARVACRRKGRAKSAAREAGGRAPAKLPTKGGPPPDASRQSREGAAKQGDVRGATEAPADEAAAGRPDAPGASRPGAPPGGPPGKGPPGKGPPGAPAGGPPGRTGQRGPPGKGPPGAPPPGGGRPALRHSAVRRRAGDRNAPELRTKRRPARRPERRRRGPAAPMAAASGRRNRPKISKSSCTRALRKGDGPRKASLLG